MTNETKQTSVDQLFDQLSTENLLGLFTYDQMTRAMEILEQAKAMHKEEMIQSCDKMQIIDDVDFDGNVTFIFNPQKYYEQTYGGNK